MLLLSNVHTGYRFFTAFRMTCFVSYYMLFISSMHYPVSSLSDTQKIATDLAHLLSEKPFFVVLFYGTLASGKTTTIQMIGKELGITEPMQSPTYTTIRSYDLPGGHVLHHIDLYRMETLDDTLGTGLLDMLNEKKGIFLIEWPETIEGFIEEYVPEEFVKRVRIELEGDERNVIVE